MIETTKLPNELIEETKDHVLYEPNPWVQKRTLYGIDEIQYLYVSPHTSIKKHGHNNQWEVWIRIPQKEAYVCLHGEEHELVNNTGRMMVLMAIKGHINYSYDDLAELLEKWGFSVTHGSLVIS